MNSGRKSPPDHHFNELEAVDSTNNYAMRTIHDGTARDGETWFAHHQFAGRGQRGRVWTSKPGENISMSIVWKPRRLRLDQQFVLAAAVAVTCLEILESESKPGWSVKWPNDLYWNDRKAAGILIENNIQGADWRFAVIGIGINVNVADFPPELSAAVSLQQMTGKTHSPVGIARLLSSQLLQKLGENADPAAVMAAYNRRLYRLGETVRFREKEGVVFETRIQGVEENGLLQTSRGPLLHGQAEWML